MNAMRPGGALEVLAAATRLGLASFGLLSFWRTPPWLVVAFAAAGGSAIAALR